MNPRPHQPARTARIYTTCLALLACSIRAGADCPLQVTARLGGSVDHIALSGTHAVLHRGAVLAVADVANLMSPAILGQLTLASDISDIETTATVAYVAAFDEGLIVVNHLNAAAPQIASTIGGFNAIQVELHGSYAYVIDASDFGNLILRVFSIANPFQPVEVNSLPAVNSRIRRFGQNLYVLSPTTGDVRIMSLLNPEAPALLGSFNAASAQDIVVSGTTAFVAAGAAGVKSFNVSNPAFVQPLHTLDNGTAYDVRINGTRLYVGDYQEFDVVNVSNPSAMTLMGTHAPANDFYPRDFEMLSNQGVFAAVIAAGTRLQIVECTIPSAMIPCGLIDSNGTNYDAAALGDYAYVANQLGIDVVHLAAPGGPARIATLPVAGDFQSVTRDGNRLYVGCAAGLRIYGLDTPSSPVFLGAVAATSARFPTIAGNLAFLCGDAKLRIVNVSNPASPTLVSTLQLPEGSYRSALHGQFLYVTTHSDTLYVINVSNPAAPTIAATIAAQTWTGGIAFMGDYLLVGEDGLRVYTVNDPLAPALIASDGAGALLDLEVAGTQVCAANGSLVKRYDLSNPSQPLMVSAFPAARYSFAATMAGQRVIAIDDSCGAMVAESSCKGDMNCDGAANGLDVRAFVKAMLDPAGYAATWPGCDILNGDMNVDGLVTTADMNAFVNLLLP